MTSYGKIFTPEEAAKLLGVSLSVLQAWRSKPTSGSLPFIRLGKGKRAPIRYTEHDINRWLESNRSK